MKCNQRSFDGYPIQEHARIAFVVIGSVMVASAVLGNITLIAIIVRHFLHHRKKCIHNVFVANLALIDMLTMGYCFVFVLFDLTSGRQPVINDVHCVINGMAMCTLFTAELTCLLTITFNRYLKVCHSRLYIRVFTFPRTLCWCLMVWVISFIFAIPPLLGGAAGCYEYSPRTHICSFNREGFSYIKVFFIVYSILPMLLIAFLNSAIFRYWKRAKMSVQLSAVCPISLPKKREWNLWVIMHRNLLTRKVLPNVQLSSATTSDAGSKASDSAEDPEEGKGKENFRHLVNNVSSKKNSALSIPSPVSPKLSNRGVYQSSALSIPTPVSPKLSNSAEYQSNALSIPSPVSPKLSNSAGYRSRALSILRPLSPKLSNRAGYQISSTVAFLQKRRATNLAREVAFVRSLLVVCFFVCVAYIPYAITVIFDSTMDMPDEVVIAGIIILTLNNSVNWIVYGAMNPLFKRGYVDLMHEIVSCCCGIKISSTECSQTRTETE